MSEEKFVRADDVTLRTMAGEHFLIVLNAGESKMFNLNGMGLWFWTQFEKPRTKSELLETMLDEYEIDRDTAITEIDRFLGYLKEKALICINPV